MSNIITAIFDSGDTAAVTEAQYMYATGQILKIEGLDLPSVYRVNFSNEENGKSKTQLGTDDGVEIPDIYFTTGKTIYAWIMLTETGTDREIKYDITIPVIEAAEPEEDVPTKEQTTIISQSISALSESKDALKEATARIDNAVVKIDTLLFYINDDGDLIQQTGGED